MKQPVLLIGIMSILLCGCATTTGPRNLTRDIVSQQIIKGKTAKEEVKVLLGKPYTITVSDYQMPTIDTSKYGGSEIDMSKLMPYETWSYTNIKEGIEKEKGRIFPLFGTLYRETTTLVISFDKNGIVQSYTFTEIK